MPILVTGAIGWVGYSAQTRLLLDWKLKGRSLLLDFDLPGYCAG